MTAEEENKKAPYKGSLRRLTHFAHLAWSQEQVLFNIYLTCKDTPAWFLAGFFSTQVECFPRRT